MSKILFLVVGDKNTPSTWFRVHQIIPDLRMHGIEPKVLDCKKDSLNPLRGMLQAIKSDVIFIQKAALPFWYFKLLKKLNPKIIYDFDDAIYFKNVKIQNRLNYILKGASAVIAGNRTLANYSLRFNKNVFIVPTIPPFPNKNSFSHNSSNNNVIVIGWIGTKENLYYLYLLKEVFKLLGKKYGKQICLKVVSDGYFYCNEINIENKKWKRKEEKEDISSFDIGLMPLIDDEWCRGKCGFKALQYMAHGIPVVASPVGFNSEIIRDSYNGFLATTTEEWVEKISDLLDDPNLRREIGENGRKTVIENYSKDQVVKIIIKVIKLVVGNKKTNKLIGVL